MHTTRPSFGKYVFGMVISLILFLAGGWLTLAPFALGFQPYGADWASQTINDFVTGLFILVVALIAFVIFFNGLIGSLRTTGVLAAKTQPQQAVAPASYQAPVTSPLALAPQQNDLDRTLATLAAALTADLTARRQADGDPTSKQSIEQSVNRREA